MKSHIIPTMGLLGFLLGCDSKSPYQKKNGVWYHGKIEMHVPGTAKLTPITNDFAKTATDVYFRTLAIDSADAATFEVLNAHYAKDKSRVYYCDDYRKGQEYWLIKYNRVVPISGADAATFRYLDYDYARDARRIYYEGVSFDVADTPSFEAIDRLHQRDKVHGYYDRRMIANSDGATYEVINDRYAKDAHHVFFENHVLAETSSPFEVLDANYAKTATHVYHLGTVVAGADPGSFVVLEVASDSVDATDASGSYLAGRKLKPTR